MSSATSLFTQSLDAPNCNWFLLSKQPANTNKLEQNPLEYLYQKTVVILLLRRTIDCVWIGNCRSWQLRTEVTTYNNKSFSHNKPTRSPTPKVATKKHIKNHIHDELGSCENHVQSYDFLVGFYDPNTPKVYVVLYTLNSIRQLYMVCVQCKVTIYMPNTNQAPHTYDWCVFFFRRAH